MHVKVGLVLLAVLAAASAAAAGKPVQLSSSAIM